jgi:hypothetical protein
MTTKTTPEAAVYLGGHDTVHGVEAELADTMREYTLQVLQRLVPYLWACDLTIEKQVHLSINLDHGSAKKVTVMADAQLNWESRIISQDGKTKIEAVLRVDFLDGLHFVFPD